MTSATYQVTGMTCEHLLTRTGRVHASAQRKE